MNSKNHHILIYDGSFEGFLCCVFSVFEQKLKNVSIQRKNTASTQLFTTHQEIIAEENKASRVWKGFQLKTKPFERKNFFKAYLSEIKGVENTLLNYMQLVFSKEFHIASNYSNPEVLKITQVAKMVTREKHRMEAFVRFELTKDNIYVSTVEPDFNVLPLIAPHFKDRYADQKWLIYDIKRAYGLYYNLKNLEIITFEVENQFIKKIDSKHFSEKETDFQKLWSTYYQSVNIKSRKNTKLHIQHIPKRYWKYLTEKIK